MTLSDHWTDSNRLPNQIRGIVTVSDLPLPSLWLIVSSFGGRGLFTFHRHGCCVVVCCVLLIPKIFNQDSKGINKQKVQNFAECSSFTGRSRRKREAF